MLTLTENASTVVKTIVDQSGGDPTAGLRISQDAVDSPALHVITAEAPQPGDQVLDEDGARVFLEDPGLVVLDEMAPGGFEVLADSRHWIPFFTVVLRATVENALADMGDGERVGIFLHELPTQGKQAADVVVVIVGEDDFFYVA